MATVVDQGTEKVSTWVIDPAHSSVEFAVKHMVIATVRGRFARFDVDLDFNEAHPELSRVEVRIEAASIDTRVADRDAHLRSADFLDADNHPFVTFKSKRIEPATPGVYRIVGDLTIRDVTREVALNTTFSGLAMSPWGTQVAAFSAEARINRSDFGLTWNHTLETGGVLVGDEVRVLLEVEAVKQE